MVESILDRCPGCFDSLKGERPEVEDWAARHKRACAEYREWVREALAPV
jgi:hypothetical protein